MTDRFDRLASSAALTREGEAWVLLMMSGASTRDDARALIEWRQRSPAHERAFREAVRLRKLVRSAATELRAEAAPTSAPPPAAISGVSLRLNRRVVLQSAIAASVAAGGVYAGGEALHLWPDVDPDLETAKSERRVVALGAGVSAELGGLTRLKRRPDLGVHGLELVSGEAVLTARTPKDQPLVVLAGRGRATADAARFNLRCVGATVSVTCLDGAVVVEAAGRNQTIPAGRQLVYGEGGMKALVAVDPDAVTAWRRGVFVFRQEPLSAVVAEINRYRQGRIVVLDAALANRRIDGTFYEGQFDQIFDQLHSAFGARVTRLPGGVVLLA